MKRFLSFLTATLLLLCVLPSLALAGDGLLYIRNPNPADRLHLRRQPDAASRSLGKFYNGAPITQISDSGGDWVKVRVDDTVHGLSLEGWMQYRYLSQTKPENAMPQYVTAADVTDFVAIGSGKKLPAGTPVSLMGVNEADGLWYLKAYLPGEQGTVACTVAQNHPALLSLKNGGCNVYVSNPNPADRLHLRKAPAKTGQDMGKYYNGCVGTLLGFSEDGQWLQVKMYGRTGWMQRRYLYIEGEGPNPTYYGIPTVRAGASGATLYQSEKGGGKSKSLAAGAEIEVLGVVDSGWLHVRADGTTGFMRRSQTTFSD